MASTTVRSLTENQFNITKYQKYIQQWLAVHSIDWDWTRDCRFAWHWCCPESDWTGRGSLSPQWWPSSPCPRCVADCSLREISPPGWRSMSPSSLETWACRFPLLWWWLLPLHHQTESQPGKGGPNS